MIVMELAVILAAGLRDWIDFGVIIAILLLNAGVGWYQEKQAADVVASLKGDIAMRAVVIRDGQEQDIKAREIVPGDIVRSSYFVCFRLGCTYTNLLRSYLKKVKSFRPTAKLSAVMTTLKLSPNTNKCKKKK